MPRHTLSKRNDSHLHMLLYACTIAVLIAVLPPYAFADGFGGAMSSAGNIIQRLALCGGALGIALCGVQYAYGGDQTASKALTKMLVIFAATAAVYMLPHIIRLAQNLAAASAWSPNHM